MTTTGTAAQAAGELPLPRAVADLPDPVRHRVVEWASEALGAAGPTEIPAALRRVARFAPAKRAKVAAVALGQAVVADAAFRALVAARAAAGSDDGAADATDDDPVTAAARAYLLRLPDLDDRLLAVERAGAGADARERIAALERELRAVTAKLAGVRAELVVAQQSSSPAAEDGDGADRLRHRLREQGRTIRELQQRLDAGGADAAQSLAAVVAERDRARAETENWRQRAEAATARADAATQGLQRLRDAAGDRRATADRRLDLLLGVLEGAASGLRREWELIAGGPSPAEVVAGRLPQPAPDAQRTADPTRLTAWAAMPGAHLIVDGYNVTKTGFPELSLSDQRDRLVRSLGALAARTSAEVTVVFDGAAVAMARPPARGIRVLFSPPGVTADDVIRDLVRAEPVGRPLIVVSSDREVVQRAVADGARTAESAALLAAVSG